MPLGASASEMTLVMMFPGASGPIPLQMIPNPVPVLHGVADGVDVWSVPEATGAMWFGEEATQQLACLGFNSGKEQHGQKRHGRRRSLGHTIPLCVPGRQKPKSGAEGGPLFEASICSEEDWAPGTTLRGRALRMAFHAQHCRVLQEAFAHSLEGPDLAKEIHGHVIEAVESPHANFSLQKLIEALPAKDSVFIARELQGLGSIAAKHPYGCRILIRLIEHVSCDETDALLKDVVSEAALLSKNKFARHVLRCILERSSEELCREIVTKVRPDLIGLATHKHASFVVQHAVLQKNRYQVKGENNGLVSELAGGEALQRLARSRGGCYVAQALEATSDCWR